MHHEDAGEKDDGQHDVHGRTGDGDHEALPAGMRHEFVGRAAARFQRILPGHFDVAASGRTLMRYRFRRGGNPKPLAEADGEHIYAYAEVFRGGIMAKFVDQDHDPEHDCHRNHGIETMR